jgi:hypothetical protein
MTGEQWIVRLVLVVPSLVLMALFLPSKTGGFQFLGIIDPAFLLSGLIDVPRLILMLVPLGVLWGLLEWYASQTIDIYR